MFKENGALLGVFAGTAQAYASQRGLTIYGDDDIGAFYKGSVSHGHGHFLSAKTLD